MAEHKVFSACPHDCPDTCAMITTVRDGKAIDVRGNPDHPFTRGGLCVKVNDYQNRVYSPDRVLHPLKRTGPKGSGQFKRISWDESLDEIKARWTAIIDRHGPASILPYSYLGTEGILNGLNAGDAFFNKLGATVGERTFCDSAMRSQALRALFSSSLSIAAFLNRVSSFFLKAISSGSSSAASPPRRALRLFCTLKYSSLAWRRFSSVRSLQLPYSTSNRLSRCSKYG